jgi:hypothetical protein
MAYSSHYSVKEQEYDNVVACCGWEIGNDRIVVETERTSSLISSDHKSSSFGPECDRKITIND